ncbi:MAG: hypothetical protein KBA82_09035 [Nitrosomonas sp.]|nr:hypothetical protein [Nitrosomonas sp.]MBP7113100.1 hypothetical protein [Nitrosomonas sp.]
MKILMYSRLSNHPMITYQWVARHLVLLFLIGTFPAHAQEINPAPKGPQTSDGNSIRWAKTAVELPAQTSESNEVKQKPGLVSTAAKWLNKTTELPGDLQIHGFASQAYITTSDNDVFGNSDKGGSFGFTEAGLNASMRPLPRLLVSAQMLSRRAGEGSTGMPRLDFGFLDYRLYSQEANQFGIRAGRLKNPFGFYNDTRDVAFTRPSILLPQSIYFDRTRNLGLSGDSVQLYGDVAHSRLGTFSTQFGVWLPIVSDKDTETSVFFPGMNGNLTREVSYIGRGVYETNDKRIRLAISGIWLNTDYNPAAGDTAFTEAVGAGSLQFSPIYFSAQYNAERWTLTSEYALRHFVYRDFANKTVDNFNFFGESFYFQGEYRFTPKWEGIVRYDVLFTDRSDRDGSEFHQKFGPPAHSRYAKDITVGLRWNITPEFMLRAEYHHVNGTGWLSRLDNSASEGPLSKHWDLFAIQASYRF